MYFDSHLDDAKSEEYGRGLFSAYRVDVFCSNNPDSQKYPLFIIISVKKPYIIIPVKNEAPVRFL